MFNESHEMQFSRYLKRHLKGEFNDLLGRLLSPWNQLDDDYKNYLVRMGILQEAFDKIPVLDKQTLYTNYKLQR